MIYECERCEAVLGPGLMVCPRCGEVFDEPVPLDATSDENEGIRAPVPPAPPLISLPVPPAPTTEEPAKIRRPRRLPKIAVGLSGAFLLVGAGTGYYYTHPAGQTAPAAITPAASSNTLPTDAAAHPSYAADMNAFVRTLRATGVDAQWPAFGSNDTLLITPQARVQGQRAEWNSDLYHALAQGVYGHFVFRRYESHFSDTDSTTCFVLVSDPSGKVVAADLMGNLK